MFVSVLSSEEPRPLCCYFCIARWVGGEDGGWTQDRNTSEGTGARGGGGVRTGAGGAMSVLGWQWYCSVGCEGGSQLAGAVIFRQHCKQTGGGAVRLQISSHL